MAEIADQPPDDPDERHQYWRKRIQGYIDSGQAAQHVQEGFAQASQGTFLDLEGFKKRESRGFRQQISQGQLHQGNPSGKKLTGGHHNPHPQSHEAQWCKGQKSHKWTADVPQTLTDIQGPNAIFLCLNCGLVRKVSEEGAVSYIQTKPKTPVDVDMEEAQRICIWCGKVCESLEALDLHEEECEP